MLFFSFAFPSEWFSIKYLYETNIRRLTKQQVGGFLSFFFHQELNTLLVLILYTKLFPGHTKDRSRLTFGKNLSKNVSCFDLVS